MQVIPYHSRTTLIKGAESHGAESVKNKAFKHEKVEMQNPC